MTAFTAIHQIPWLKLLADLGVLILALIASPPIRDRIAGFLSSLLAARWWSGLRPALTHLLIYYGLFLVVVIGAMFWIGGLTPADVGLQWSELPDGALYLLVMWVGMQVLGLLIGLYSSGRVSLYSSWKSASAFAMLTKFAIYAISVAAVSEVVFRGFLVPQTYFKTQAIPGIAPGWALLLALIVSQVLTSTLHLPRLLHLDPQVRSLAKQIAVVFIWSLALAVIYVRTGNLFVCMGAHTLTQLPTPLVKSAPLRLAGRDRFHMFALLLVVLALLWVWPVLPHVG